MEDNLIGVIIGGLFAALGAWSLYTKRLSWNLRDTDDIERRSDESYREHRERRERWVLELRDGAARTAGTGFFIGGVAILLAALAGGMVWLIVVGVLAIVILGFIGVGMQVVKMLRGMPDQINEKLDRFQDAAAQAQEQMRQHEDQSPNTQ
jgi:uncharacterized membrane protein YccC